MVNGVPRFHGYFVSIYDDKTKYFPFESRWMSVECHFHWLLHLLPRSLQDFCINLGFLYMVLVLLLYNTSGSGIVVTSEYSLYLHDLHINNIYPLVYVTVKFSFTITKVFFLSTVVEIS